MSGFVIGVRLMCDIKFISELLLRVMMFLSELEQIFRKAEYLPTPYLPA